MFVFFEQCLNDSEKDSNSTYGYEKVKNFEILEHKDSTYIRRQILRNFQLFRLHVISAYSLGYILNQSTEDSF